MKKAIIISIIEYGIYIIWGIICYIIGTNWTIIFLPWWLSSMIRFLIFVWTCLFKEIPCMDEVNEKSQSETSRIEKIKDIDELDRIEKMKDLEFV